MRQKDRVANRLRQDAHNGAVNGRKNGALRPSRFHERQERKQAQADADAGQESPDIEERQRIGKAPIQHLFAVSDQHNCGRGSKERPNARNPPTAHKYPTVLFDQMGVYFERPVSGMANVARLDRGGRLTA